MHLIKCYANRQYLVELYNCWLLFEFIGLLGGMGHGSFYDTKSHPYTWMSKEGQICRFGETCRRVAVLSALQRRTVDPAVNRDLGLIKRVL